ncbi:hypothetical protein ZWY2020_010477 [Hordeum vulgare]|nr:hypothetical protein ZWY2020_010477 [Hordeum vulgare]
MTSLASNLPIIYELPIRSNRVAAEHRIIEETSLGGFVRKSEGFKSTTQFSPCDSVILQYQRSGTCGLDELALANNVEPVQRKKKPYL